MNVDPEFAKDFVQYEKKVTQKLQGADQKELQWRKTLSLSSLIALGDQEVYDKCTVDEIMNPIGTMPKGGFKSEKEKKPEPEKKSVSPPNKF